MIFLLSASGLFLSNDLLFSHLVARCMYPLLQCFINYLMWSTSRGSPLKESAGDLTLFRSHLSKFLSTVGSIFFHFFLSCGGAISQVYVRSNPGSFYLFALGPLK